MKAHWPIPLLVASALAGCASNRSAIGDGAFLKRHLRTGWHVDLGWRDGTSPVQRLARLEPTRPATLSVRDIPPAEPVASTAEFPIERPERVTGTVVGVNTQEQQLNAETPFAQVPESPTPTPSKDSIGTWNPWAIPALIVALGTVAYAILGTSELVVVLAVIATLVLASIAVRKGRMNEWRGKGFAIAALMVGALAALITMIALLAGA